MGRFLLGFVVGAAIGAAVVVITSPRSGRATREGIRNLIDDTIDVARQARADREQAMWSQFRARLKGEESENRSQKPE
jgi:gas vesicle protein